MRISGVKIWNGTLKIAKCVCDNNPSRALVSASNHVTESLTPNIEQRTLNIEQMSPNGRRQFNVQSSMFDVQRSS